MIDLGLKNALNSHRVSRRINMYPKHGYSGSVISIIDEIFDDFHGMIITPIDSPFGSKALLMTIKNLATLYQNEKCIIVPCFGPLVGHPIYFSRHFFLTLKHAQRLGGLRGVMASNKKFVRKFYYPCARILANINAPADLLRCRNHIHTNFKGNAEI